MDIMQIKITKAKGRVLLILSPRYPSHEQVKGFSFFNILMVLLYYVCAIEL